MSSLRAYYTAVVDEMIDAAGVDLSEFDLHEDITRQFVPAYWAFIMALKDDIEYTSLQYYAFLLDVVGVPDDDPERSWDFATLKTNFAW